jgi:hypothetical protein
MLTKRGPEANRKPTIEHLATKAHLSYEEVEGIYEVERIKLDADARIKIFLPILAIRNARKVIHRRAVAKVAFKVASRIAATPSP